MTTLIERMRGFEVDHEPDGWPGIRMREVSALCDALEAAQKREKELWGWLHWCESMMRPVFGSASQLESIREVLNRGERA